MQHTHLHNVLRMNAWKVDGPGPTFADNMHSASAHVHCHPAIMVELENAVVRRYGDENGKKKSTSWYKKCKSILSKLISPVRYVHLPMLNVLQCYNFSHGIICLWVCEYILCVCVFFCSLTKIHSVALANLKKIETKTEIAKWSRKEEKTKK